LIQSGWVQSCHDLSEGGLAVGLAEMAIAGGLGVDASLADVPCSESQVADDLILFSESPSRFLLEVAPEHLDSVLDHCTDVPIGRLGTVLGRDGPARLTVDGCEGQPGIDAPVDRLRACWRRSLDDPLDQIHGSVNA